MRGKRPTHARLHLRRGNIPAYAGKTARPLGQYERGAEHPRVCGENLKKADTAVRTATTSPRMRGKLEKVKGIRQLVRNIPAYAGKTPRSQRQHGSRPEHPRIRGENCNSAQSVNL